MFRNPCGSVASVSLAALRDSIAKGRTLYTTTCSSQSFAKTKSKCQKAYDKRQNRIHRISASLDSATTIQFKLDLALVTRSHLRSFHASTSNSRDKINDQPVNYNITGDLPLPKKEKDGTTTSRSDNQGILSIWQQAQSIPNRITFTRLACTPLLCGFILNNEYAFALAGCSVAAFSDWLDGYIAKNYNGKTPLGSYMDPLADKVIINSLATSLCFVGILPVPLVGVWILKDTILVSFTLFVVARNQREDSLVNKASSFWYPASPLKVEPTMLSKVNTVMQFGTLGVAMVHPLYPMVEALNVLWYVALSMELSAE